MSTKLLCNACYLRQYRRGTTDYRSCGTPVGGDTIIKRFLYKINKTDTCWNWIGAKTSRNGYGRFKFRGKLETAHRVSYILFKGEIPKGMLVCHKCDNPKCVNPEHFFIGTQKENVQDCLKKGRRHSRS